MQMARSPLIANLLRLRGPGAASILIAVLVFAVIALAFAGGLRRGMDHKVELYERDQWAIAIALSDVVYHLDIGYVGYATVLAKLKEVWDAGAKNAGDLDVLEKNYANREVMNNAIRAAAALGPQEPGYISDRTLVTMVFCDTGYVDFTKLAFRIFGLKIESLYYTFFLLLSFSSIAYLLAFWRDHLAKITLLVTLFAFLIELHTNIFNAHMPTPVAMRHASALALVPMWHFAFLIIFPRRPSIIDILAALTQLAVLLLAIKMRGSAGWVPLFVGVLAAVLGFWRWRQLPREHRSGGKMARAVLSWPIVLLFSGLFLGGQYANSRLNPVYFTDDVLSYHEFWEGAWIGILGHAPELLPQDSKAVALFRATNQADQAGYVAASEYLAESRFLRLPADFPQSFPRDLYSPFTGDLKYRLVNESLRPVVLGIAMRHPVGMLKLYLYTKPIALTKSVAFALGSGRGWPWLVALGALCALWVVWQLPGALEGFPAGLVLLLAVAVLPFAALPNLWTFEGNQVISDIFLMTLVFFQVLVLVALVTVVRTLLHLRSVPMRVMKWHAGRRAFPRSSSGETPAGGR
jgi:hypothetical protein